MAKEKRWSGSAVTDDPCAMSGTVGAKQDILLLHRQLGSVVPVLCGYEICAPGHSFGPVQRSFYLLHYVMEGRGTFWANDRRYELKKGQLFVIRPGEMTRYRADEAHPWYYVWIGFSVQEPLHTADFILDRQDVFSAPECRTIFRDISESGRLKAARELYLCGKIYELLAALTDSCVLFEPGAADYVARAKTYIEANYAEEITVQGLAHCLGLSRSYFSAVFSKAEGISPQEYLVDYRLRRAAELIADCGMRPGEAAAACGYSDVFGFSKMFKKKFGVPPGRYRIAGKP